MVAAQSRLWWAAVLLLRLKQASRVQSLYVGVSTLLHRLVVLRERLLREAGALAVRCRRSSGFLSHVIQATGLRALLVAYQKAHRLQLSLVVAQVKPFTPGKLQQCFLFGKLSCWNQKSASATDVIVSAQTIALAQRTSHSALF
jgi:hypothetical protein